MPTGHIAPWIVQAKLHHDVRGPSRKVDIVPALKHSSLLSTSKFDDANYVTVLKPTEVLIYYGNNITIQVSS